MLIFGSRAMKHWYPDFHRRVSESTDTDYITPEILKSTREHEYHWVPAFQYVLDHNKDSTYVDPNFLYTIKVSHAAWDIHWDKTMKDIRFLQSKGCELNLYLYATLTQEWNVKHGKKKVNLNKPNEYFFTDAVTRVFNHDELHDLLKFYEAPLHTKIRSDPNVALPSFNLWMMLDEHQRFECALEEIYVIATERYILPMGMPPRHAKYKAMKQLITSMTKGWFNLFLIVNFDELYYNENDERHWMPKLKDIKDDYQRRN